MTPTLTTKLILDGAIEMSQRKDGPLPQDRYDRLLDEMQHKLTLIDEAGAVGTVDQEQIAIKIARAFGCGEHYQGERRLCLKHRCFCRLDAAALLIAALASRGVVEKLNAESSKVTFNLPG